MLARERFPRQRLQLARAVGNVEVYPFYMETLAAALRHTNDKARPIRIIAYNPADRIIDLPEVNQQLHKLYAPNTALYDVASKPEFEFPKPGQPLTDYYAELSGQRLELVGSFLMSTDFANDGNLIMSSANFARYFPNRAFRDDPLSVVDMGIVTVKPGTSILDVKKRLIAKFPEEDVTILTKDEIIQREQTFWRKSTPIGYIFFVGEVIGFVVGVIICYQIIYSDLDDHMGEFATLKAMGYTNLYFAGMVLFESFYLALLGFVPGAVVSFLLYQILARRTGLFMVFHLSLAGMVLLKTLGMCAVSGFLALRKLLRADPASLF
jgi:putative ABC transport system permease protein